MKKQIGKFFVLSLMIFSSLSASRMYINDEDLDNGENAFHIHIGDNVWIQTDTIHRDKTGLYTFESRILREKDTRNEYEKRWKCPYCYKYWPIGTACQNKDCPSKYK